jgi:hypothetical protein
MVVDQVIGALTWASLLAFASDDRFMRRSNGIKGRLNEPGDVSLDACQGGSRGPRQHARRHIGRCAHRDGHRLRVASYPGDIASDQQANDPASAGHLGRLVQLVFADRGEFANARVVRPCDSIRTTRGADPIFVDGSLELFRRADNSDPDRGGMHRKGICVSTNRAWRSLPAECYGSGRGDVLALGVQLTGSSWFRRRIRRSLAVPGASMAESLIWRGGALATLLGRRHLIPIRGTRRSPRRSVLG